MKRIVFSYLLITLIPALGCGGEFPVNTHTSNKQENAAIAMDANSNWGFKSLAGSLGKKL